MSKLGRLSWRSNVARLARYPAPVRLGAFLLGLALLWLPPAVLLMVSIEDANTLTIATMALLFLGFLLTIRLWGRWVHQTEFIFRHYGLGVSLRQGREFLQGWAIGLVSVAVLFVIQGAIGWISWQAPSSALGRVGIEGAAVALGVGFAEELVFRGWVLDELERDYSPKVALWSNSLIFALAHFLKPLPEMIRTLPQFPALTLLGLTLVWAKWSTAKGKLFLPDAQGGRLGLPIGLHGGLVWGYYILNVGDLIQTTPEAPQWITGIDGNPLAGGLGILALGVLAVYMKHRATRPLSQFLRR